MANHTPAHRRSGLDLAQKIARLASKAPDDDSKKAIFTAANWLRRRFGISDEVKRDEITAALLVGCANYEDIFEETKIARCDIITLVKQLETGGLVDISELTPGDRGGRPPIFLSLTAAGLTYAEAKAVEKLPTNKTVRE